MGRSGGQAWPDYDVVIVGAGFAGLYMLYRARLAGLSARVFEAGSGVGGTWYWNRYPGARCDVPSLEYSYSFDEDLQQEWSWPEKYSAQPQILRYLDHVSERFDLRGDIIFNTRVAAATFDGRSSCWRVTTDSGDCASAQFVIMAVGSLSSANIPEFPGLDAFGGDIFHTARWPHHPVDFTDKRVAVVGTGSSGVQVIPEIAKQAGAVTVFQRTASYSLPSANGPLDLAEEAAVKEDYRAFRAANRKLPAASGSLRQLRTQSALDVSADERDVAFEDGWRRGGFAFTRTFPDLMLNRDANKLAADFARAKIRSIVNDPETAELLSPKIVIGCKRMCIDSGYFETFNRDNVRLVDVGTEPISAISADGLRVGYEHHPVDSIVFATGFDAMTGPLLRLDIRGAQGRTLAESWRAGPATYLGLGVSGFPNLFMINGPGSPSVLTNMVVSIEHHVEWIADCILHLKSAGRSQIEALPEAQVAWVSHVNEVARESLHNDPGCNSWYLGSNIPGKPRVFMPLIGFPPYVERCEQIAANGYAGFSLDGSD
jgi:cyclohexanone monooxygenase